MKETNNGLFSSATNSLGFVGLQSIKFAEIEKKSPILANLTLWRSTTSKLFISEEKGGHIRNRLIEICHLSYINSKSKTFIFQTQWKISNLKSGCGGVKNHFLVPKFYKYFSNPNWHGIRLRGFGKVIKMLFRYTLVVTDMTV